MRPLAIPRKPGGELSAAGFPGLSHLVHSTTCQFTYRIESSDTRITFPAKPSEATRALLKGAGFRWSPSAGCWWRRGCKGAADFITALDRKLNPGQPDGACWKCQSPHGFFRPHSAAAPVYCDTRHADRFDLDYEDRCRDACDL